MSAWPVALADVERARERLRPHLPPTPLRSYPELDAAVGRGVRVLVSTRTSTHRRLQGPKRPLRARRPLPGRAAPRCGGGHPGEPGPRARLGRTAPRAAGHRLRPRRQHPEKNAAARGLGARLVEEGRDSTSRWRPPSVSSARRGSTSSTPRTARPSSRARVPSPWRCSGGPGIEALVFSVGGGSQAVGGLTVARALSPELPVRGPGRRRLRDPRRVAPRAGRCRSPRRRPRGRPRHAEHLPLHLGALREGFAGFVTVTVAEIAEAVRLVLSTAHSRGRARRAPPTPAS